MTRIVKLGGSLFDWPQFPAAVQQWLSQQPAAFNVLLPGAGTLADAIRRADRDFALGEERSHWLCIDALSISAKIAAAALPQYPLVSDYADLKSRITAQHVGGIIFDSRSFFIEQEPSLPGHKLPHDWTATSDSIAARLAETLAADELVLLKSTDPPIGSLMDLAAGGYVDRYFPTAAAKLAPPRFVNLRATSF